eukprot:3934813-Rhodomonas_salina.6
MPGFVDLCLARVMRFAQGEGQPTPKMGPWGDGPEKPRGDRRQTQRRDTADTKTRHHKAAAGGLHRWGFVFWICSVRKSSGAELLVAATGGSCSLCEGSDAMSVPHLAHRACAHAHASRKSSSYEPLRCR